MRAHEVLEYVIMKSQPDEDTSCWALFEVICDGDLGKWISCFVLLLFIAHTWCLNEMLCNRSFTVSPFCGYLLLVFFIDHLRSCVVYNFSRVCMSLSVRLSDDNFESLEVGSSYLHMQHISTHYGSSSYMKVFGSRSRSQEPKRSKIPILTV